jgi:hypothetical protein
MRITGGEEERWLLASQLRQGLQRDVVYLIDQ